MEAFAATLACAQKDVARIWRDRMALLLWMGIPLAIGGMIVLAMGGRGGPKPRAKVLVADRDESTVSQILAGAFSQGRAKEFFELTAVEEDEGRRRMAKGEASALIVIPEGFGAALLDDRETELELVKNPSQRILPGLVEEPLEMLVDLVFYAQRILGDEIRDISADVDEDGPSAAQVAEVSTRIHGKVERVERFLFPPAIELASEVLEKESGPGPSPGRLFFPGMLFMALAFVAQGQSEDLWKEKRLGTLRRAVATPGRTLPLLAGKLIAVAALVLLISVFGLALGAALLDVPPASIPAAAGWCTLAGTAFAATMLLLQSLATSARGGNILTNLLLFPLLMVGGGFFPFEAMPAGLAAIGRRTPNGWATERFKAILAGQAGAAELAIGAALFMAAILVAGAICARRLRSFART